MKPADAYRAHLAEYDRQRLARMRQQPETPEARYFVPLTRFPAYTANLSLHENQP